MLVRHAFPKKKGRWKKKISLTQEVGSKPPVATPATSREMEPPQIEEARRDCSSARRLSMLLDRVVIPAFVIGYLSFVYNTHSTLLPAACPWMRLMHVCAMLVVLLLLILETLDLKSKMRAVCYAFEFTLRQEMERDSRNLRAG
jgi:hypothetical protein